MTRRDLLELDRLIKDSRLPLKELLRKARRLQCSIRFRDVFKRLAPGADPTPQARPALWGVEFSDLIVSPPRALTRQDKK